MTNKSGNSVEREAQSFPSSSASVDSGVEKEKKDFAHAKAQPTREVQPEETGDLLRVVQAAYLKHHCGLDNIGWEELSDRMCDALCNAMGDVVFQRWLADNTKEIPNND